MPVSRPPVEPVPVFVFKIDQGFGMKRGAVLAVQDLDDPKSNAWIASVGQTEGTGSFSIDIKFQVPSEWAMVKRFEITSLRLVPSDSPELRAASNQGKIKPEREKGKVGRFFDRLW